MKKKASKRPVDVDRNDTALLEEIREVIEWAAHDCARSCSKKTDQR